MKEETATSTAAFPFTPSSITHGQLCDAVLQFFAVELGIAAARVYPLDNRDGTMEIGGHCPIRRDVDLIGYWQSRADPSPDPTEGLSEFNRSIDVGHTVLIADSRTESSEASGVKLAARVGGWNAQFEIRNTSLQTVYGPQMVTDAQLEAAARFLVDTTSRLDTGKW
ncbi:hypothetical protein [Nocardia sp. NPDC050413]|uniref:hypothetical protein n=1 Tax=Nocardia sp. NPDC050413 TaxID=3155784 RepID=UPI0033F3E4ED